MRRLGFVLFVVGLAAVTSCAGSDQRVDAAAALATDSSETSSSPRASTSDGDEQDEGTVDPAENTAIPGPEGSGSSPETGESDTDVPERGDRGAADSPPTPTTTSRQTPSPESTVEPSTTPVVVATPTATPRPALPTPMPTPTSFSGATATTIPSPTANPAPPTVTSIPVAPTATLVPTTPTATAARPNPAYFETVPPGSSLPSDAECAALVRANPSPETHPENAASNARVGGPSVLIDGAEGFRSDSLAARISGNFTGTTDEILRWASCKWGIDEDITRARAWTESSWRVSTQGDQTTTAAACAYLGLASPCYQSYGLLQVKGTIHEGTYPHSFQSTAWGVDYAMAWQRACFEGAFTWLDDQGYTAGNLTGCVGAWYSGEWFDDGANRYLDDVGANLRNRPWD